MIDSVWDVSVFLLFDASLSFSSNAVKFNGQENPVSDGPHKYRSRNECVCVCVTVGGA